MKKKRGKKQIRINIKLDNRWLYTFVVIGILLIIGVGVFALGTVPDPGHAISELQPCADGETLQVVDGVWSCADAPSTYSLSCTDISSSSGSNCYTVCSNNNRACVSARVGSSAASCSGTGGIVPIICRCCKLQTS